MNKKYRKKRKDSVIYRRVAAVLFFISLSISSFFVYDIVLMAMSSEEDNVPAVSENTEVPVSSEDDSPKDDVPTAVPLKMYISDKTVFLAHLRADGKSYTFPFKVDENATVQTLLDKAGVTVSENDYINLYNLSTPLFEDIYVEIGRITYEEVTNYVDIAYTTEYIDMIYAIWKDTNLSDSAGKNGTKAVTKRIKYVNGKQDSVTVLSEKIIKKPTTAIVYRDVSNLLNLGGGSPSTYVTKLDVSLTAYTYVEEGGLRTYTGEDTRVGYVAVDRSIIPMHSYLYIVTDNGFVYGYCYAKDTGGGIKGNSVDLFLPSLEDANEFGRQGGTMYVITYGDTE